MRKCYQGEWQMLEAMVGFENVDLEKSRKICRDQMG